MLSQSRLEYAMHPQYINNMVQPKIVWQALTVGRDGRTRPIENFLTVTLDRVSPVGSLSLTVSLA